MAEEEKERAEKAAEEQNKPWFVAEVIKNAEDGSNIYTTCVDHESKPLEFKLQIEADQWIKENAMEDVIYASVRRGKICRATLVRKIEEL